jgi:predicted metal-binding membrane protein
METLSEGGAQQSFALALRSQRAFLAAAALLFATTTVATVVWCGAMADMDDMPMPGGWSMSMAWMRMPGQSWSGAAATFVGMWVLMMVAMMLPALLPMLWRYRQALAARGVSSMAQLEGLTAVAAAAYFTVWSLLGVLLYPLGVALADAEMQWPALARAVPVAIGVAVLVAGALQFSSWKSHQLACCRGAHERAELKRLLPNAASAWRHGLRLGMRCVNCCAGPTAVLLGIGVMDLRAMVIVTVAITAERVLPAGEKIARLIGAIAIAAGLAMILRTLD